MVDAPERIWTCNETINIYINEKQDDTTEYVRADLFATLKNQRNQWQKIAQQAGVCMTCAIQAPEPYGCTDCMNTGFEGGKPSCFVSEDFHNKELSQTRRKALEEAEYGFDQIHKSLMGSGPKQAAGEVASHFLEKTREAIRDLIEKEA